VAEAALKAAYGDGATFWNRFTRAGRRANRRAAVLSKQTDAVVQASLTSASADPGVLGDRIKEAIPTVARP